MIAWGRASRTTISKLRRYRSRAARLETTARVQAVRLLVAEGEVLDRHAALRVLLDAAGDAGGHAPGQQRVLREAEVAPAQDGAVQVEGGGQPQMRAEVIHLGAHEVTEGLGQLGAPGLGDGGADGDGGGVPLDDASGVRGLSETPIMESNIPRDSSSMSSSKPAGMDESSAKAPSSSMPTLGAMRRPRRAVGHDETGQALEAAGGLPRRAHQGSGRPSR